MQATRAFLVPATCIQCRCARDVTIGPLRKRCGYCVGVLQGFADWMRPRPNTGSLPG
jgi:hypothetical protein